ncbi:MAG: DNA helicase II [Desulfobulbus propionicus]|nr:MAG: DNA helicase II [Desulfobulbus propionicus]
MQYRADLHIHSAYSRATSASSTLQGLAAWAAIKGIDIVGTGDFTHPAWYASLCEQLVEDQPGLYRLRDEYLDCSHFLPVELQGIRSVEQVRFVLTAEISSIYKKAGRVRKNHNILLAPDLESVQKINQRLANIGNLKSDGRPILGLDAKNLLEILLENAPEGFFVPAHIWTPWFSLFGSKSGFDTIEACFEDLTPHIFALETGLSSDPEMNRCVSALDGFTLVSNSDCHSPGKLGREANIFDTEPSFYHLRDAIRNPRDASGRQVFTATVEFYPEEGKYHCDGHRKCQICFEPQESRQHDNICPVCRKPLTIGVLNRVMVLADRERPLFQEHDPAVYSVIPLPEVLSELLNVGPTSKKVRHAYAQAIRTFGSEFSVLLDAPLEEIGQKSNALLQEAIRRIRDKEVIRRPGFDGAYGVIRVFAAKEKEQLVGQGNLFGMTVSAPRKKKRTVKVDGKKTAEEEDAKPTIPSAELNVSQQAAVDSTSPIIAVQAGPGSGKTHTLVARVRKQLAQGEGPCTVITFTNKAADEIRSRFADQKEVADRLQISTFHGYCLRWLREKTPELQVLGSDDRPLMLMQLDLASSLRQAEEKAIHIQRLLVFSPGMEDPLVQSYHHALEKRNLIDMDCIIPVLAGKLQQETEESRRIRMATGALFVDEFQDINHEQYELVSLLAESQPVFVIGDPDQSIYGFRGADARWFSRFAVNHHAQVIQLTANYRSGLHILRSAERLIAGNTADWVRRPMRPIHERTGSLYLCRCTTPNQEARCILDHIEAHLGGTSHRVIERMDIKEQATLGMRDIVVLFRTGHQMEPVSRVLQQRGIPYQRVDQKAFYTTKDMRPLYYAILFLAGRAGIEQQLYLLQQEPGVGERTLRRLALWMGDHKEVSDILGQEIHGVYAADTPRLLWNFQTFFQTLKRACGAGMPMVELVMRLAEYYGLESGNNQVRQLHRLAVNYGPSLDDFSDYLQRYSASVLYEPQSEAITLSTLHAAKGLEFKLVFLAGFEDGLIPLHPHNDLSPAVLQAHIEEERRLLYVGMTRAVEILYLTWCGSRVQNGKTKLCEISPFSRELIAEHLQPAPVVTAPKKKKAHSLQLSLFS